MKTNLNRPWLTASDVERSTSELKEISKFWDEQIWNDYLNWYQSSSSEKLVSKNIFDKISEELEKNIFEEFGYKSCPKLMCYCDQLLTILPAHQSTILSLYFLEGKSLKEIAFEFNRSDRTISYNKFKAITALKRVHGGEPLVARQYMRGARVFIPRNINSIWTEKLSHPITDQRAYEPSNDHEELLNHKSRELREIFAALSTCSRQIIYLKFWCNKSNSQIARECSIGLNTVEEVIATTVFKIKSKLVQNITEDKSAA